MLQSLTLHNFGLFCSNYSLKDSMNIEHWDLDILSLVVVVAQQVLHTVLDEKVDLVVD